MANLKSIRSWNAIWEKVQSFFGFSGVDSPFSSGPAVIDEPLTLYVETWGNDANPGTVDRPFATPNAALDYLRKYEIAAAVTVQVGAGTFPGIAVWGFRIAQNASGASITVIGTTSDSVTGTHVQSTVNGWTVYTDSSKSWTTNEHRGKIIKLVPASGIPFYSLIWKNTATELFLMNNMSTALSYAILSLDTVFSEVSRNGSATGSIVANGPNVGQSAASQVLVERIRCTGSVILRQGSIVLQRSQVTSTSTTGALQLLGGTLTIAYTSIRSTGASTPAIVHQKSSGNGSVLCILNGALAQAESGGIAMTLSGPGSVVISGGLAVTGGTGIQVVGVSDGLTAQSTTGAVNASDCTTAILLSGRSRLGNSQVSAGSSVVIHGTNNGTALSCNTGSAMHLSSTSTITGTTEISVDGVTSTIAAMRANSPKIFPLTPNPYGSYVYE